MKKIVILGGGTFSPIRNHLSLCAPAFGTTAKNIQWFVKNAQHERGEEKVCNPELILTAMAGGSPSLRTNEDVEKEIDKLIADDNVGTIILNVAFCDFDPVDELAGFHGPRLQTSLGDRMLQIRPAKKIIDKIRRERPDIFLVGFKTTTGASTEEQFLTALKMMKRSKCNLVLANDTVTRHNMIITPEESKYEFGTNRRTALKELVTMTLMRNNLTYNRTVHIDGGNVMLSAAPDSFVKVMQHLIVNKAFIENNGNGFTPGHFCWRPIANHGDDGNIEFDDCFVSSQRKVNHNNVFTNGMTEVIPQEDDSFKAIGSHKPSVGARSQWLLLKEYEKQGYDCIVHFHCPLKSDLGVIGWGAQRPYQCGSLECGTNTLNNLKEVEDGIMAVYLEKHGPNILFKSSIDPQRVIDFIDRNFQLGTKVE